MSFLFTSRASKFRNAFIAVELGVVGGAYYVFHSINTSRESRIAWDERAPWLIDAFHAATGSDEVIAHRAPAGDPAGDLTGGSARGSAVGNTKGIGGT